VVADLHKVFCPKKDGGVLNQSGVVDFAIGVHPGVFLVVTTDSARLRDSLIQRDMGNGPNYCLFRPFHLCSIEVPLSAAQTVIYGESSGHPQYHLTSECITIAKRDLKAGEVLDGVGGNCYRVSIDHYAVAKKENLLPAGLAKGCVLTKNVNKDEPIANDVVQMIKDSVLRQVRKLQESLYG
jgi:predicted homoserine dehydrogenase-like protein